MLRTHYGILLGAQAPKAEYTNFIMFWKCYQQTSASYSSITHLISYVLAGTHNTRFTTRVALAHTFVPNVVS